MKTKIPKMEDIGYQRGLIVRADNTFSVKRFGAPLFSEVSKEIGGFEHVNPRGLREPYCFVCDDEFIAKELPTNLVGCSLYGTATHGHPILGDIVILKHGYRNGEPDIVGLDDNDLDYLIPLVKRIVTEVTTPYTARKRARR